MDLKQTIRTIPDFPIKGVMFRDVTTLIKNGDAFKQAIDEIKASLEGKQVDLIIGPEARGFIVGTALAYAMGVGFVPARKPGKLPSETIGYEYSLEYGTDRLEIHTDAIQPGQNVVIADDLLATGGTALAVAKLVEKAGGHVVGLRFLIELDSEFDARAVLKDYDVSAVLHY